MPETSKTSEPSWRPEADGTRDQTLEENWLFRLRRERFRSRVSGKVHDFYVVRLADAVNVVALTPGRQIILVRQFRAGSGQDSLEPPGGLLEPGEDPRAAGARELLEETGYAGDPAILLGTVWSNPSIMSSQISTILVTNARHVAETKLDHNEEVAVALVPADQVPQMIKSGEIDHGLSVGGLLWWLVSELPGNPLSLRPAPKRWRIRGIMVVIALLASLLALAVSRAEDVAAPVLAAVILALTTMSVLDRRPRSTLGVLAEEAARPLAISVMAAFGFGVLYFGVFMAIRLMD